MAERSPGIIQKAKNLIGATAKHIANRMEIATSATQEGRWIECFECEKFSKVPLTCKECGCGLVKKISWASSECPLNKW